MEHFVTIGATLGSSNLRGSGEPRERENCKES